MTRKAGAGSMPFFNAKDVDSIDAEGRVVV